MRLFVALEIPNEIRRLLDEGSRALRRELPKARWVGTDLMHLTLVFLGETDQALLSALHRELNTAFAGFSSFEMTVTGAGAFPPRGRSRVLWAGIDSTIGLDAVEGAAAKAIERAGVVLKERRSKRPYHPHVTLARCKTPWPRWATEKLQADFGDAHSRPFHVDHGTLIESELGRSGPRYTAVGTYPLKTAMEAAS